MSLKLKKMDRKRKRIYRKERRSDNWKNLEKAFKKEIKSAKSQFYSKTVSELKLKKPGEWYKCLKKISSYDQQRSEQPIIDEINHLSDQEQAEIIADKFASIQNEFQSLKEDDINIPCFTEEDVPQFHSSQVWFILSRLETNKATVSGDFPARLIKHFAAYLAEPLSDIFNTGLRRGEYPQLYKYEVSTPVQKVHPTQSVSQMRNISGLLTFDKVYEKLLAQLMVSDM